MAAAYGTRTVEMRGLREERGGGLTSLGYVVEGLFQINNTVCLIVEFQCNREKEIKKGKER